MTCSNPLEIHTIVSIKKFLLHLVTLLIIPRKEFGSFTCREVTRWKEKDYSLYVILVLGLLIGGYQNGETKLTLEATNNEM